MGKGVTIRLDDAEYEALVAVVGPGYGAIQNGLKAIIRKEVSKKRGASEEELLAAIKGVIDLWRVQGDGWKQINRILGSGYIPRERETGNAKTASGSKNAPGRESLAERSTGT